MDRPSKILYVEDNKDTARAVEIIFTTLGYEVDLAFTGQEGLQKLEQNHYDLVILDVMLPDISGMEIFGKVKNKTNCKYAFLSILPVSVEKLQELKKEGVVDYINKPFKKDDLVKRVQTALGKKR